MLKNCTYENCLIFIEKTLKINLTNYQKLLLKYFFENKVVHCGRAVGRSLVAECFGKYITYEYNKNENFTDTEIITANSYTPKLKTKIIIVDESFDKKYEI